jgi:hypothetical protein
MSPKDPEPVPIRTQYYYRRSNIYRDDFGDETLAILLQTVIILQAQTRNLATHLAAIKSRRDL